MSLTTFVEAVLLGVALAMDALAVSVALGSTQRRRFTWDKIAITAAFFGFFQFFMPVLGFYGSSFAENIVADYGRWVAGVLLMLIGIKMFFEQEENDRKKFSLSQLTVLAIATSIDALLVGVSFRCLHRSGIILSALIIGIETWFLSGCGCLLGRWSGRLLGKHCIWLGAAVLTMLGIKIIFLG